jgi:ATP-dependent helicase HrpB
VGANREGGIRVARQLVAPAAARMMPLKLPIDAVLHDVVAALERHGAAVVQATPGAGKTTRIPPALLAAGLADGGDIVVLEPRRLAARLAARRVAEELGERVGERVGYQVRFERRASRKTRIHFVTEGVLTRRLMRDPGLRGVSVVVLDELHERHVHTDLALVLLERLRRQQRQELKLVVMSATLEAEHVAELLHAPIIRCDAKRFDVAIEYLPTPSTEPLDLQIASAARRLFRDGVSGHVLAFLPGAADIRRAQKRCEALARDEKVEVLPLYGALPAAAQDAAVATRSKRALILATNVAESSITIDGVEAVIDSGLVKRATHSRFSALSGLQLSPISQASATQRAGRAGRTRSGRCLRLYSEREHARMHAFDEPEILRSDLSDALLALRLAGVRELDELHWLTPPPNERLELAHRLLIELGASEDDGTPTDVGKRMASLPLDPRLARTWVEAMSLGVDRAISAAVALVAERGDLRARHAAAARGNRRRHATSLWHQVELFEEAESANFDQRVVRELSLDRRALMAVKQAREQLLASAHTSRDQQGDDEERALAHAWLSGHRDRVAKRVGSASSGPMTLALAGGGSATIDDREALGGDGVTLVLDASEQSNRPALVRLAMPLSLDTLLEWLLDNATDELEAVDAFEFNAERERVEISSEMRYRGLTLESSRKLAKASARASEVLFDAAKRGGLERDPKDSALERWLARARHASLVRDDFPSIDEDALMIALRTRCEAAVSFAQLRDNPSVYVLEAELTPAQRKLLTSLSPERVQLGDRRSIEVSYPTNAAPFVASYLQDFYGMPHGPRAGALPVVLQLWAPNRRAVQVTSDLEGFWQRHYPTLRRQLSRRYPKHHWPEDPRSAPAKRLKREL